MKFDVVVGNPPYQEENTERNRDDAIYHLFLDEAYKIGEKVEMITPARFLFNVGSTPTRWNEKMLNDEHLSVVFYEQDSGKIFPNTAIIGGIAVTYRDANKKVGKIGTFTPHDELRSIVKKIEMRSGLSNLGSLMFVQNKFDLEKLYEDYPEFRTRLGGNGRERRLTSSIFDVLPEIFSDMRTGEDEFLIYGRENNQRKYKYVPKKYIAEHPNMYKWKVFVPAANGASGTIGDKPARIISTPVLGVPDSGHTQTFISIGAFDTEFEGKALLKYIKSKFARAMLGVLKVTQNNKTQETWSKVPLLDFSENSDIDWTKSEIEIDQQLYKKYGLDEREISFIETHLAMLNNATE